MKFYFCEHGTRSCIFSEKTMAPIWKRTGGDVGRCIRHGDLITIVRDFPNKKAARKWIEDIESRIEL